MAQNIQIVPKFSFPYVETVVNDYTVVNNSNISDVSTDTTVRYIFPFISSKGVDNRFIRKRTRADIVSAYGETNWKKYGQPLMQALAVAEAGNTEVWCMRVMPDDATYAHNIISAYYKGDTEGDVASRKFRIKYVQKHSETGYKTIKSLLDASASLDGTALGGVYTDGEGYTQIPGVVTLYAAGRGKYGNNYRVRLVQDIYYEKDYGIKYYDFDVISTEAGLNKEATYVGSLITSSKYSATTLINDVLDDVEEGIVPVFVHVDEDGIDDLYNAYVEWATDYAVALKTEIDTPIATDATTEEVDAANVRKDALTALLNEVTNIPDVDCFDAIFGHYVATDTENSFIEFITDGDDSIVDFGGVSGVQLFDGNDGAAFDSTDATTGELILDKCYKSAFDGTYDRRILTSKRIKAAALWDANYSLSVKKELAKLAMLRNDAICYLDCGIMETFGTTELNALISDYSVFNDFKISKNVHHYYMKESSTKKRVPVTITYFLAKQYAEHVMNYGSHIPFVKSYAQLTGHMVDSLAPSVEDFETELKETLAANRFNYFETVNDNVYQRATQNTSQMSSSDLLEENNVSTLYAMKRIVEADITDRLYNFTDENERQRFRNYEKAKFADWSSREVESFDIDFRMNAWEADRSILHAYLVVAFRGLQKRAILEIDVNKRAATSASNQ